MNPTEASFLTDVSKHGLEVKHLDGIYRQIRFRQPNTNNMSFDLVTWPGYLAYTGDMGNYLFSRLPDMFEFFRSESHVVERLQINPRYWAEKCIATDREGIKQYSPSRFRDNIRRRLNEADASDDLHTLVEQDVLSVSEDEYAAVRAAMDFRFKAFQFHDFRESDNREYTYRFIWCCYAIAWGIRQYDDWRSAVAA